ncbi:hypothetical protein SADUNF_Sadunf16G0118200 [Salix dunnii]|uniref:Reverse transcriptase Ty1/copia-type domain-containing protein n=1 Tax=Salix dunnii TaxID=1413687 RepID=A0A835J9Q5_9ROSI|nr:hypothetical protein SADUNF_Sadunf16G0118200 [Salix dunnii]
MASTCHLTSIGGSPFEDVHLYRSVVGSLQYMSFTWPNLALSVHKVIKYMHKPLENHWMAMKRILCYLKHSISTGLYITSCSDFIFKKELTIQFISSSDRLADALTKHLLPVKFKQVLINLNVRELPSRLSTDLRDEDQEDDPP